MDRISALRNIEDALQEYEDGQCDLGDLEDRVGTILRTYATAFEAEDLAVYRAEGGEAAGTIVAAVDEERARSQISSRLEIPETAFELDRLD